MAKPKYLYEIDAREFIARSDDGRGLILQQAHPLGGDRSDAHIFMDRRDAKKLRDAIGQWLAETHA